MKQWTIGLSPLVVASTKLPADKLAALCQKAIIAAPAR
jgi:hypothetical protein